MVARSVTSWTVIDAKGFSRARARTQGVVQEFSGPANARVGGGRCGAYSSFQKIVSGIFRDR